MKIKKISLAVLFILIAGNSYGIIKNQKAKVTGPEYAQDEIVVKFKPGVTIGNRTTNIGASGLAGLETLNSRFKALRMEKLRKADQIQDNRENVQQWHKIIFSGNLDMEKTLAEYRKDSSIEHAQPNYRRHVLHVPNDPYYASSGSWEQSYRDLWGLDKLQMEQAWDITKGSPSIIIAVIDTGLDETHPDMMGNSVAGWNFCNDSQNVHDDHGHGTHVSGIIAAKGNNGLGIAGVAYKCKIMPLKALDIYGYGEDADLAAAIIFAANNGAKVINMSWGGIGESPILADAIAYACAKGCVQVVAAGNENADVTMFYPANDRNVITVAATDQNDEVTYYSNWGSKIDISAPGGFTDILSLRASNTSMYGDDSYIVGGIYYRASGTSMATPYVSGVTALMISVHPELTSDKIKTLICASTDDLGDPGWDLYYGYGRVNALKALQSVSKEEPIILHTTLSATYSTAQYLITASIEDFNNAVASATLYWSAFDPSVFNEQVMSSTYTDFYSAYIPGQTPGTTVYYYMTATDAGGYTAKDPAAGNHSFEILVDTSPPFIDYTPLADTPRTLGYPVSARITDNAGIADTYLYWNTSDSGAFNRVTMTAKYQSDNYISLIPGQSMGTTIYYYLYASDINYKSTRLPPATNYSFSVIEDTVPPVAVIVSATDTFRIKGYKLTAQILDNNLVKGASLYWNSTGSDPFTGEEMTLLENNKYGANITNQAIGSSVYYYIVTTDYDNNTRREPPAGTSVIKFRTGREVLLVNGSLDEAATPYYTSALDENWYTYDMANSRLENPLDAEELKLFDIVIWFTGQASYGSTLSENNVTNLQSYLNSGGKLFITGSKIASDLYYSSWGKAFLSDYLHAQYVRSSSMLYDVRGVDTDITQGRAFSIYFGDGEPVNSSPDDVNPVGGASESIFKYVLVPYALKQQSSPDVSVSAGDVFLTNTAGLSYKNAIYRLVYLAFGFEGIDGQSNRSTLMQNILYWLKSQPPSWESKLICSYPNPASGDSLTFVYYTETQSNSDIYVYNIAGELVKKLSAANPGRGVQSVNWDISAMAPGLYVYVINTTLPDGQTIRVGPQKLAISYK